MQSEMQIEPECPGYDKCPVAMCGCRWLGTVMPWTESDEQERNEGET